MGALYKIRPNMGLINQVEKMTWKKYRISDLDKKLFRILATNPNKMFLIEELGEILNITPEDVVSCAERLEKHGLSEHDMWQPTVIIDGDEYVCFKGKIGIQLTEGLSDEQRN